MSVGKVDTFSEKTEIENYDRAWKEIAEPGEPFKIKKYISCHIPYKCCNFRCSYCYVRQLTDFSNEMIHFASPEYIRRAFSRKRIGGTALVNFCAAGETLLHPEVVPIICAFVEEGHYVSVVTNGTIAASFQEFVDRKVDLKKFFFKFSFHYAQMKQKNLLDTFWGNVNLIKKHGASFTIEVVASDDVIPYMDEIKDNCLRNAGALPQLTLPRDDRTKEINLLVNEENIEEYQNVWSEFDSELFKYKLEILHVKRKEYCHAGDWSLQVNLKTGEVSQCVGHPTIFNIYDDICKPIGTVPVGEKCRLPYCYNGHVYLTLGDIEGIQSPTYYDVRDRQTADGGHWFTPQMREIFSQRLYQNNHGLYGRQKQRGENVVTNMEDLGRIALWGGGKTAEKVWNLVGEQGLGKIVACADVDKAVQGKLFHGMEIISPIELQGMILAKELEVDSVIFAIRNGYLEESTSYFRFCKGLKGYIISDAVYFDGKYKDVQKTLLEIDMTKPRLFKVQTDIVGHCNLKCKACLNYCNLVEKPQFSSRQTIIHDWERLKELFWGIYRFRILGGEPLLSPDLGFYAENARRIFPDATIWIVTNGLLIRESKEMEALFQTMRENCIKFDISVYEPILERLSEIEKLLQDNKIGYALNMSKGEFYKILRRSPDQNPAEAHARCRAIDCHDVKDGKIYICSRPSHIGIINTKFGTNYPTDGGQYNLDEEQDGWVLKHKLHRPFSFCAYCASPQAFKWERTSPNGACLDDWIVE